MKTNVFGALAKVRFTDRLLTPFIWVVYGDHVDPINSQAVSVDPFNNIDSWSIDLVSPFILEMICGETVCIINSRMVWVDPFTTTILLLEWSVLSCCFRPGNSIYSKRSVANFFCYFFLSSLWRTF